MESKNHIIIVDDNKSICQTLSKIFKKKGYETDTAITGQEAIEKTRKNYYNVAILDIKLPDIEGTELLARLKEIYHDIEVIIITGNTDIESAINSLNNGASAYFLKPLDIDNLLTSVRNSLEKQRLVTEKRQAEQKLKESEEKYKNLSKELELILDNVPALVFYKDTKNNFIRVNKLLADGLNMTKEEIQGENCYNIYPYDVAKACWEDDLEVIKTNRPKLNIEEPWDTPEGRKWCLTSKIPLVDEKGKISGIIGFSIDITDKKYYENLISDLNLNFLNFTPDFQTNIKLLLNTVQKLIKSKLVIYARKSIQEYKEIYQIICNNGEIIFCDSEKFKDDFFMNVFLEFDSDIPQKYYNLDKTKYAKTDPFLTKYNIKNAIGKVIKDQDNILSALCVLKEEIPSNISQENLVLNLVCKAIEIEEHRGEMQQKLEEQNKKLNELTKIKSGLLNRASHELKTPLIAIRGFIQLLLELYQDKCDEKMVSIMKELNTGSIRLENIVKSLLETSKFQYGKIKLNLKIQNLSNLIKNCVNELKGIAELRNQSIIMNIENNLITKFDKERIYEVFSNILMNAIKNTHHKGMIEVSSKIENSFYVTSVKDNGIGFTEEEKKQIFVQFGKIERYGLGWDLDIEGPGLGLYLTKKNLALHGGKIWMESKGRNRGSTFYFSLPIIKN